MQGHARLGGDPRVRARVRPRRGADEERVAEEDVPARPVTSAVGRAALAAASTRAARVNVIPSSPAGVRTCGIPVRAVVEGPPRWVVTMPMKDQG